MEVTWKPKLWVAVILGVLLQPLTFLYINKSRLFWAYFVVVVTASAIDWYLETLYSLIFSIICPLHAYFVVKYYDLSLPRSWYSRWWGILSIYASFLIPVFLIRSFFYEPFSIPGASMSPTLNIGDNIIVKKVGYGTYGTYGVSVLNTDISEDKLLERGKVYVFYPPHTKIPFVKRLIAIPGDTVEVSNGQILLNGQELSKEFIYSNNSGKVYKESLDANSYSIQRFNYHPQYDTEKITLPEKSYFFMGDNRDKSSDSRVWGLVSSSSILGEVVYIFR